ncbi:hypothetical protein ANANG_G00311010 [Anguilla anguilla]|uniref:non-specific serine/threonine protein kinase n=1 Tax=Anguilla anguilla TaxID=7936 RepID=A0A9D3RHK5_ANGAN|nr:hypothetical protein ANANG_G00311010 [Anguilla anguilla]
MEAASISSIGLSGPGAEQAQGSSGKSRGDKQIPPSSGEPSPTADGGARRSGVKKHHHKHNLKHRYELLETLGRGTYGKVKKAIEIHTGRKVAIKSVRKEKIKDEQDMAHIRREIEIMSSLRHPHIISVYEVFENKDKIVIVMEYASKGELYDFISERHRLSERETRRFFRQIVSAVHYCHKNGVVHRDLKLENVLLDENCNIKIADFGLSNLYHKDRLLQTFCGSPLASPEIVNGRPYRGPEVDSWALGVLLYTLVYGTMPFDGGDHRNLIRQISNGEYREPTQSSDARGLIRWMLMVNPESGPLWRTSPATARWRQIRPPPPPRTPRRGSASSPEREEEEPALAGVPPKMAPSLPKKGILKSSRQRESGYYSSPERSESSEQLGALLPRAGPPAWRATPGPLGRCSRRGGVAPTAAASAARPNIRPCVSAENLLQLAGFRAPWGGAGAGARGSPGDDGSFAAGGPGRCDSGVPAGPGHQRQPELEPRRGGGAMWETIRCFRVYILAKRPIKTHIHKRPIRVHICKHSRPRAESPKAPWVL